MRSSFRRILAVPPILTAALLIAGAPAGGAGGEAVELVSADLSAWRPPTDGWAFAGEVHLQPDNPRRLAFTPGQGIIVTNGPNGRGHDLVSKRQFRDSEVHVEFLISKGSNSGVKLHGHYEIQIFDSYGKKNPTASDLGGIYPRAEMQPKYHHIDEGTPPRVNAAKPPGEWQTLDITFRAPRFDAAGERTEKARFVKVVVNGQVVHDNVELNWPTGNNWHNKELTEGPLLLQGDHGPVAFRSVRVKPITIEK